MGRVECLDCATMLPPSAATSDEPCPECGSRRHNVIAYAETARGTATAVGPRAVAKEWDPGYKGGRSPARKRQIAMSRSANGLERSRRQDFDYAGDWYEETILDPDGSLRHHQAEPLTMHRGHGSDKPKD